MAEINEISCEVIERVSTTALRHWSGHQRVEGREGDQRPLGEGLSKEKGKAGWKSWNLAKAAARDKKGWGGWADNVMALCAFWRNER